MKKVEQQVHARDAVRSNEARARRRFALPLGALMSSLGCPSLGSQSSGTITVSARSSVPRMTETYVECERLVKAGAPIDAIDDAGQTALYYAAWRGHIDATRVLIALGADVNKP